MIVLCKKRGSQDAVAVLATLFYVSAHLLEAPAAPAEPARRLGEPAGDFAQPKGVFLHAEDLLDHPIVLRSLPDTARLWMYTVDQQLHMLMRAIAMGHDERLVVVEAEPV